MTTKQKTHAPSDKWPPNKRPRQRQMTTKQKTQALLDNDHMTNDHPTKDPGTTRQMTIRQMTTKQTKDLGTTRQMTTMKNDHCWKDKANKCPPTEDGICSLPLFAQNISRWMSTNWRRYLHPAIICSEPKQTNVHQLKKVLAACHH